MARASLVFMLALGLSLSHCAATPQPPPAAMSAPLPDNGTIVSAEVVEAEVVDSTTLNIQPKQPIVVLRLKLLSVKSSANSFLNHKPGEIITVYSKESAAAALSKKNVAATLSLRGDERGGSLWAQQISALGAK